MISKLNRVLFLYYPEKVVKLYYDKWHNNIPIRPDPNGDMEDTADFIDDETSENSVDSHISSIEWNMTRFKYHNQLKLIAVTH